MSQMGLNPQTSEQIAQYFSKILPSQQETLGQIVVEILRSGKNINRKSICTKLLLKLETAEDQAEERHYQSLIALLFGRED